MDKHLSDEQLIEEWIVSEKITKEHAELEVGELRAATERARVQILRDLSILLLAYGEKEKFKRWMFGCSMGSQACIPARPGGIPSKHIRERF